MTPAPVFVVGSPRSGTSILTWCLGQHPNILPIEESNWIAKFAIDLGSTYELGASRGERSSLSAMGITSDQLYQHFGRAIDQLVLGGRGQFTELSDSSARRAPEQVQEDFKLSRSSDDPKTRWVDGTPECSFAICGLTKLFPSAKFIHIVRDVSLVVKSMMSFATLSGTRLVETEQAAYDYWMRAVRACLEAEQALGARSMLRIRYSDLVSEPERTLRICLDFLSEGFDETTTTPLKTRINSSGGRREYALGRGHPDPRVVQDAEALSAEVLADVRPDAEPDPEVVRRFEEAFAARVAFVGSLDEDRLKLLRQLRRVEAELEDVAAVRRARR
jgi:hypothetical protein